MEAPPLFQWLQIRPRRLQRPSARSDETKIVVSIKNAGICVSHRRYLRWSTQIPAIANADTCDGRWTKSPQEYFVNTEARRHRVFYFWTQRHEETKCFCNIGRYREQQSCFLQRTQSWLAQPLGAWASESGYGWKVRPERAKAIFLADMTLLPFQGVVSQ